MEPFFLHGFFTRQRLGYGVHIEKSCNLVGLAPMNVTRLAAHLSLVAALFMSGCTASLPPITPVTQVDVERYMGRWYVIAAIPTFLEKDAQNAVETYRLSADGSVCTWFRLRKGSVSAPVKLIHSKASIQPDSNNARWWVHFYHLLKMQYLVGWLKPDYSQVLVVRDARDHLWYMARQPSVSASDYQAMLERATALGYHTQDIVRVPQQWPETSPGNDVFGGECP
jgi:apolipoprotein D and lipocalin family protein